MKLIPDGVTMEIHTSPIPPDTEEPLLGYGFAVAGDTAAPTQIQHWFLFSKDLRGDSFPGRIVTIRPTINPSWLNLTLEQFKQRIRDIFDNNPDKRTYVVANCAFAAPGETITLPPQPPFKPRDPNGGQLQGFWGISPILVRGVSEEAGLVYVHRLTDRTTVEHWVLFDGYQQPTATAPIQIGIGFGWQDSTVFPRIIDGRRFDANATYVLASCTEWTTEFPDE